MTSVPTKAVWVDGNKGKGKVLIDMAGFRLRYKKKDGGKKYFICPRKEDTQCMVSVTLDIESDMIVRAVHEHNHDNDIVKESVEKIVEDKIASAIENQTSPRSAFMDISNKILSDPGTSSGLPYLPKMKTVARRMARLREDDLDAPPIPKTWEQMIMPDNFKTTTDGLDFVIMDTTIPGTGHKIWGFASPAGLDVMSRATDLFADGTFEFVNQTLFKQLWVIVARLENNISIPCAYYLLSGKDANTYKMVLENLKENGVTAPDNFHVDYEAAAIKAIRTVYQESEIVCCDTHWKRCIRTNLQKFNLLSIYNQDAQVQTYIRKLWALSLVPPQDVVKVWELLRKDLIVMDEEEMDSDVAQDFNNNMLLFLMYFEQTWIGVKNPRTNVRGKPKFAIKTWNKFNQVKNGEETTTNVSEAWNSASKHSLQMKPSIWAVLAALRKEESLARAKLHSSAMGDNVENHPGRTKKREERATKLREILMKYEKVQMKEYLDLVASFYNS